MPWPPSSSSRRVALVIYGLALLVYTTLSGLLFVFGLSPRATVVVAQIVGLLGLSLALAVMLRIPVREAFALRPADPVHWYMALAAAIPLQAAGGAMQFAILDRIPPDAPLRRLMEQTMEQFIAVETTGELLMLVLAAVLTAAVCEEFLFRGLLLQLWQRRSGWTGAVVSTALLFAVFHLNPIVLLPVAIVGGYLAVLVWRSGSLYPAILGHALNNGLALFGLPLLFDEETYRRWVWVILALSTAVFIGMLRHYLRSTPAPRPARRPGGLKGVGIDGGLGDGEQPQHAEEAEQ